MPDITGDLCDGKMTFLTSTSCNFYCILCVLNLLFKFVLANFTALLEIANNKNIPYMGQNCLVKYDGNYDN